MGLGTQENGKYVSIVGGRFCIRVPEGSEGAVTRVNKLGKTVHEKYYDNFTGRLVGLKTTDGGTYGKQWEFSFQDAGEVYKLQLGYTNSFAKNIIKMLPNADLTKEMKISPSTKVEADGTKKSSIFINQDGKALKHAYTKDAPNGLPQMTQVMVKGTLVWDDTDQMVFLEKMVNEKIIPKLGGVVVTGAGTTTAPVDSFDKAVGEIQAGAEINPEDIPF
jgi:hypothetical protein